MAYTKEYFLEKAHEVHGEKYDYSKVNYINQTEKVCIICPKHDEFWQSPYLHLRGRGCNQCAIDRRRMTKETFIQKAKEIHGDKYDYSKVEYKTTEDKVCIICPEHGEFWQTPHMHIGMDKNGCPKCSKTRGSGENGTLTTEEFIEKARKVHGDRYDYSKVDYKNSEGGTDAAPGAGVRIGEVRPYDEVLFRLRGHASGDQGLGQGIRLPALRGGGGP